MPESRIDIADHVTGPAGRSRPAQVKTPPALLKPVDGGLLQAGAEDRIKPVPAPAPGGTATPDTSLLARLEDGIRHNESCMGQLEKALQQLKRDVRQPRESLLGQLEQSLRMQQALAGQLGAARDQAAGLAHENDALRKELERARELSLTDDLTRLPNRRAFVQRLEQEISRARRSNNTLVLAMIDLDGFKAINDAHGHAVGDAVLQTYARRVMTGFRHHDMVARFGGEEFAAILPDITHEDALAVLRKAQTRAARPLQLGDTLIPLPTFSAGVAMYHRSDTLTTLLHRADEALYRAKRRGRNRIEPEGDETVLAELSAEPRP